MHYVIADSEGSVLGTYGDRGTAVSALRLMVNSDPDAAADVLLLTYDDKGAPAGEAEMYEDLVAPAFKGTVQLYSEVTGIMATATYAYTARASAYRVANRPHGYLGPQAYLGFVATKPRKRYLDEAMKAVQSSRQQPKPPKEQPA